MLDGKTGRISTVMILCNITIRSHIDITLLSSVYNVQCSVNFACLKKVYVKILYKTVVCYWKYFDIKQFRFFWWHVSVMLEIRSYKLGHCVIQIKSLYVKIEQLTRNWANYATIVFIDLCVSWWALMSTIYLRKVL